MKEQERRPLVLSDILEVGARLVFGHLPVFARITALLIVPLNVIYISLLLALGVHPVSKEVGYAIIAVLLAGGALVLIIAGGACLGAASGLYRGERPGARASFCAVRARLGSFLLLVVIVILGAAPAMTIFFGHSLGRFGFLALIAFVLSLWLVSIWSVAAPAFLIEGKRVAQALKHSRALVRGHFYHALGAVVLGTILALFAVCVAAILVSVFMTGSEKTRLIVYISGVTIGELLAIPLLAAYEIVLYYDLRFRNESYDLGSDGATRSIRKRSRRPKR